MQRTKVKSARAERRLPRAAAALVVCLLVALVVAASVLIVTAATPTETNVALKKNNSAVTVTGTGSTGGNYPLSALNDGNKGNYWDGGPAPGYFLMDLGHGYVTSKIVTYPLRLGDDRGYHYEVYVGLYENNYDLVFSKTNDDPSDSDGDTITFDTPRTIRYIYVKMTGNTLNKPTNTSVHMSEIEVWGYKDESYKEPEQTNTDMKDPNNIAYGKPTRADSSNDSAASVTDGASFTTWISTYYPSFVEVDLGENYTLDDAVIYFPTQSASTPRYYYYTLYGSKDGNTYDRLYQKRDNTPYGSDGCDSVDLTSLADRDYRFVRLSVEYVSDSGRAEIAELRLHGTATAQNSGALRDGDISEILGIEDYNDTEFNSAITKQETIDNLYGIVERTVGAQYRDWFTFEIAPNAENDNDYFEITNDPNDSGRILIRGGDGVSVASGLNYYYKNYCNVFITEQASSVSMPSAVKRLGVGETIRKETAFKVRYAMNYCTLEYTFAFFDEEAYQHENDWLALNGVNVVLDLAGQEAVWIKFLQSLGYSYDDAKTWLTGPAYYAWQFMGNMESYGGNVPDGWVSDRLAMARRSQRWKNSLGMQTILQGYAGIIPTDFNDHVSDANKLAEADILTQGQWCGYDRPSMLRTDGELYDRFAEKFYEAQRWAFGNTSDYYAVDPFHEGGIRPKDLSEDKIAKAVLDSMLAFDEDAVWVIQSWQANPTTELLSGIAEFTDKNGNSGKDHAIVLDLTAMYRNRWEQTMYDKKYETNYNHLTSIEFQGTPWVWCLLKNYGANPSMDWGIERMVRGVKYAQSKAEHMVGIGIISEATFDNPLVYDLLFELVWDGSAVPDSAQTDTERDKQATLMSRQIVDDYMKNYAARRYGIPSENADAAWALLRKTVYNTSGRTTYIMAHLPYMSAAALTLPYSEELLEQALELLLKDYDKLKDCEAYRYDLTEVMRQVINNYAVLKYNALLAAYNDKDAAAFSAYKAEFLRAFAICDEVQSIYRDQMLGDWIGRAEDLAENYDDYTYDLFVINAKALITTWGSLNSATTGSLLDYSFRNFSGMMCDLYLPRWESYLSALEAELKGGEAATAMTATESFHFYWQWVMDDKSYSREPLTDTVQIKAICDKVVSSCFSDTNIALGKDVTASFERTDNKNYPAKNATDGNLGTYWDGGPYQDSPYITVDLGGLYNTNRINVINYYNDQRYYKYTVETSIDGKSWTEAYKKDNDALSTKDGYPVALTDTVARYVRVTGTFDSKNPSFHLNEIQVYGTPASGDRLLSSGKPTTDKRYDKDDWHNSSYATDGIKNTGSFWDGGTASKSPYLIVDLEGVYSISSVTVTNYYFDTKTNSDRYYRFEVYTSSDMLHWSLLGTKTDSSLATADGYTVYATSATYARYIKVVGTAAGYRDAFHIVELEVMGKDADSRLTSAAERVAEIVAAYRPDAYTAETYARLEAAIKAVNDAIGAADTTALTSILAELEAAAGELMRICGASLLLNDSINLVYTAAIPAGHTNVYMVFELCGRSYTVTEYTVAKDGRYSFVFDAVLPQQMRDEINARLYATADGEEYYTYYNGYSIRRYCEYQLKSSTDAKLKTLISDILTYGAEAQKRADYNTDALATDGLAEGMLTPSTFTAPTAADNIARKDGEPSEHAVWESAGLCLRGSIELYFTFTTDHDDISIEFTLNGRTVTIDKSRCKSEENGSLRVYLGGIHATELGDAVTARFLDKDGEQVGEQLTYSAVSYIYDKTVVRPATTDLELIKAIYSYAMSTKAYAGEQKAGE